MRLPLLPGAKPPRCQVYRQAPDAQAFIDEVHDELHAQGKMSWSTTQTPGALPAFVVWKWVPKNGIWTRVGRVVVDSRPWNKVQEQDYYPMPTQEDIIIMARGKRFITIVDAAKFFHQWRVHPDDVKHQAIVTHRGQELLYVVVMGNANSVPYV